MKADAGVNLGAVGSHVPQDDTATSLSYVTDGYGAAGIGSCFQLHQLGGVGNVNPVKGILLPNLSAPMQVTLSTLAKRTHNSRKTESVKSQNVSPHEEKF